MSKIEIPEEIKNQFNDEFDLFADTKEARDFCFGNYNNATRDEQVGRYCYVNAKTSSYGRDQNLIKNIESLECKLAGKTSSNATYINNNKKLQQRILELEKDLNKYVGMHSEAFNDFEQEKFEHESSNRYYKEQIAKRDQLISDMEKELEVLREK